MDLPRFSGHWTYPDLVDMPINDTLYKSTENKKTHIQLDNVQALIL